MRRAVDHADTEVRIGTRFTGFDEHRNALGVGLRPHLIDRRLAGAVDDLFTPTETGTDDVWTAARLVDQIGPGDEHAAKIVAACFSVSRGVAGTRCELDVRTRRDGHRPFHARQRQGSV